MAVSNRVADATLNYLYPKLVDQVVTQTEVNKIFLKGAKAFPGAQVEIPIKWQSNPNTTFFSGFDTLPTTAVDNTVKMTFDAKYVSQSTVLPITDITLNATPQKVADLLKRQVASDAYDMGVTIATSLYGDGSDPKQFTGLAAAVDDGTSVTTYGGLSRSTYSSLDATVTASGGTLTLAKMYTLWDTVTQGMQQPSMILTTKTIRSLYEQLLVPNIRYSDASTLKVGTAINGGGLMFRNVEVTADTACTSGVMFMLNMDTFQFYAIKDWQGAAEAIKYSPDAMEGEPNADAVTGLGFATTEWTRPVNQMVWNKFIVLGGNLTCNNPRYNGKLTGITSI